MVIYQKEVSNLQIKTRGPLDTQLSPHDVFQNTH